MADFSRRLILPLTIAAASVALLVAGFVAEYRGGAGRRDVVRLAMPSNGAAFWPAYVAAKQGFYDREGLDVRLSMIDPNITVSSLIGGAMDVAFADSTQLLYALDKKADLVALGLSVDRQPYRLMAAGGIGSVAALKGKKIGVASAVDVYTYVIKMMLRGAGLDPTRDVEWVVGGNQQRRFAAIAGGNIDAGLFSPPSDSRLRGMGFNGLAFAPDVVPHLMLSTQAVRRDWARAHGDVLRRLLAAQVQAVRWLYDPANKAQALAIIMERTAAKPADAEEAYKYFVAAHAWGDGCVRREGLVQVIAILRQSGQLQRVREADAAGVVQDCAR